MARTYKSYKALGTRTPPPIFHEVSATVSKTISYKMPVFTAFCFGSFHHIIVKFVATENALLIVSSAILRHDFSLIFLRSKINPTFRFLNM